MFKYIFVKEVIAPLSIIIVSIVLYAVLSKIIKDVFNKKFHRLDNRKSKTMLSLILNTIKYLIVIIALVMILDIYGIDTKSIITSLGIVGFVVGLAFQDTLKDFISGLFIIFEDQYGLGDTVTINEFKGEVISLGLKTTKIKSFTGEVEIIPNRNIAFVINHSLTSSRAIVDVSVSYNSNLDKVEEVLNNLCARLSGELEDLTGNVEILGIESLGDSGICYRLGALTKPMSHIKIQRIIRKEIKKEFDKFKIEIPFPQVVVHDARL